MYFEYGIRSASIRACPPSRYPLLLEIMEQGHQLRRNWEERGSLHVHEGLLPEVLQYGLGTWPAHHKSTRLTFDGRAGRQQSSLVIRLAFLNIFVR